MVTYINEIKLVVAVKKKFILAYVVRRTIRCYYATSLSSRSNMNTENLCGRLSRFDSSLETEFQDKKSMKYIATVNERRIPQKKVIEG